MYIKVGLVNLVERFRKILNFRGIYNKDPLVMPVVTINDDFTSQVMCYNAERTSTGTTALVTTPSGREETWITAITLTIAEGRAL